MKRRNFLQTAGVGLAATAIVRPAIAQSMAETKWRLTSSFPKSLDIIYGAAEVFAAALHDRADATTVGETTVGMAIVQRQVPTQSGGSLFMTVGRYLSPSGTPLGGKGLAPDDRVLVFPGEPGAKDAILERGLEVARGATPARRAA